MSECDICGGDADDCECEEHFVQYLTFEGGPLDGCHLEVPGNQFIVDVFIGLPAKMDGDEKDSMTGEHLHQYAVCNTTRVEGSTAVEHFMGHIASRKVPFKVINKVFVDSRVNPEERAKWLAEIDALCSDSKAEEEQIHDDDDDDEDDGEEWKQK